MFRISTPDGPLAICGVVVPDLNDSLSKPDRKNLKQYQTTEEAISAFKAQVLAMHVTLKAQFDVSAMQAVAGLHDIKTAVTLLLQNCDRIINRLPGKDDYERIQNAPSDLKTLLTSSHLLRRRLEFSSIVANPMAASYGQRRSTPVFKIMHRLVYLFQEFAYQKRVGLRMAGQSYNTPQLFDSFETIGFVLIDNAIKYSLPNNDVVVKVEDRGSSFNSFRITIESIGPVVAADDRTRIFEKGYRSANAFSMTSSGSGLGLFIAKTIADANGCKLWYQCSQYAGTSDGLNALIIESG